MIDIYNYTVSKLEKIFKQRGHKAFHARQVFEWLYKKDVTSFSQMTNISKALRNELNTDFMIPSLEEVTRQISKDGTKKFLLKLDDNNIIETVLMRHSYGNSVCVTTQLGCNIGCTFCASGLQKKLRDLTVSEIVSQVIHVKKQINERISHVVVMGIGEPFDNYSNTLDAMHIMNSPYGLEIGARHITVSTSGIVPKIMQFAKEETQFNLAISLHAPNNKIRSKLMKINDTYPIEKVLDAATYYIEKTNRRVTFEYILLEGVNDEISHANQLSDQLRGLNCYVNLIQYNTVKEFDYTGTKQHIANAFHKQLLKRGITATLRREQGGDIDAACGQLRGNKQKKE